MAYFRVTFDVLQSPRIAKGRMVREVEAVGTDPKSVGVRTEIKTSLAQSCETDLAGIRLRVVVGPDGLSSWNEDKDGVDDVGIDLSGGAPVAVEVPKAAHPIPSKEDLFNSKRTKDELLAVFEVFNIPVEKRPTDLGKMFNKDIAAWLDNYFRPADKPATEPVTEK